MRSVKRFLAGSLACAALLAGGMVVAERRHEPAGPDSFLGFQVESTDELVAVLKSNPVLRKRYARHFGVSEAEAVDFIKRSLIPYRLPRSRTFTVYGVTKSGRIYAVRSRLARGERVWATRSGVPILKWRCANPMTRTLPGVRMASAPRVSGRKRPARSKVASLPPVYERVAPSVEEFITESLVPPATLLSPDVAAVAAGLSGGGGAVMLPAAAAVGAPGGIAVPVRGGGGGIGALPLAFLPFALLGSSGGSPSQGITPTPPAPTPPVIPPVTPPVTPPVIPPVTPPGETPPPVTPPGEVPPVTPPGEIPPPVAPPGEVPPVVPPGEVPPPVTPPVTPPGEIPPVTPPGEVPPPEVIPEPGTFGLLAFGIPSLVMAARYRRRKGCTP